MNVANRKLFANRDARKKLAAMGGIMASSPELLGEAQLYQQGGYIAPTMGPTELNLPSMRNALSAPEMPLLQPLREAQGDAPKTSMRLSNTELMTQTQPVTIDYMGQLTTVYVDTDNGEVFDASGQNMMFTTPREEFEKITGKVNQAFQRETEAGIADMQQKAAEARSDFEQTGQGASLVEASQALEAAESMPAPPELRPDPIQLVDINRGSVEDRDVFAEEGPGAVGIPAAPTLTKQEPAEDTPAPAPDIPSLVETATDPDKSTAERNSAAATDALTMLGVSDAADMSPKERVQSYEKMFKEMLGEEDEDTSKEMWHNMAMIGFAIASGEDPNALTNISRGLLEGTKMMKEDRATKRKREDAIATMAIEAAMEDRRAEEKFGRDLTLAAVRGSRTGTQEPFVDAVRVLAQKGLDSGIYTTMEEALGAADAALRPYYGGESSAPTGAPTATAQQAEAAAKAAGQTEFVWNGNRYPVR